MVPLPEEGDSKTVIFFKCVISMLTVGIIMITSLKSTIKALKFYNKKMGFHKE